MIDYAHSSSAPRQPRMCRIPTLLAIGLMAWAAVDLRAQQPPSSKASPQGEALQRQKQQQEIQLKERQRLVAQQQAQQAEMRFHFTIDPQTPLKDLLPTAPTTVKRAVEAHRAGLPTPKLLPSV